MRKFISTLFQKGTVKNTTAAQRKIGEEKISTVAKKEKALKTVGERYGRAITHLSDT